MNEAQTEANVLKAQTRKNHRNFDFLFVSYFVIFIVVKRVSQRRHSRRSY